MAETDNITLDTIATDPSRAGSLSPEARSLLIVRAASVLALLSAGALTAATPAEGPRLLRVKEVAERLRCSRGHVYELVKQGKLPAIHDGKSITVREEAIRDYLHQHERR
jgi:excisionase family DNA binding protein